MTHGRSKTRLYQRWNAMVQRCTNPKCGAYPNYGARDIEVCDRWLKFENFIADMGDPPSDAHSIERCDNNKGYGPGNCIWATKKEQSRNTRRSIRIEAFGVTRTMIEWADVVGLPYEVVRNRIRRAGWSAEKALSTPVELGSKSCEA